MKKRAGSMWRGLGGTGEIRDAGNAVGLGTRPTNVGGRRSKLRGSREGGCGRTGRNC